MISDPISDLLARIRNGSRARRSVVEVPTTKILVRIAEILQAEGYVAAAKEVDGKPRRILRITLKYDSDGISAIQKIHRVSRPALRRYARVEDLRPVLRGYGCAVVSTNRGVFTDKECRRRKVGGEVLLKVW